MKFLQKIKKLNRFESLNFDRKKPLSWFLL
jgi:hypothetical protein